MENVGKREQRVWTEGSVNFAHFGLPQFFLAASQANPSLLYRTLPPLRPVEVQDSPPHQKTQDAASSLCSTLVTAGVFSILVMVL